LVIDDVWSHDYSFARNSARPLRRNFLPGAARNIIHPHNRKKTHKLRDNRYVDLLVALLAAVCFGSAAVFEAQGARAAADTTGIDPRLLIRVMRNRRFVIGFGVDTLGFVFEFVALRSLPLFLVQAAVASSLAVTAVLAARLMHERLGAAEWVGVAGVCAGLALLGLSAGPQRSTDPGGWFDLSLGVAVVVLGLASVALARCREPWRSIGLGFCSGTLFGVVALSIRTLGSLDPSALLRDPAVYLVIVGGALGYLLFATAVQRGSVTAATAASVVGEACTPAAVGLLVLGDSARHGLASLAVIGFLLAIAGALMLARFGELNPTKSPPPHGGKRSSGEGHSDRRGSRRSRGEDNE
jgi:drug/metabolite transporter (DMT)-like permease